MVGHEDTPACRRLRGDRLARRLRCGEEPDLDLRRPRRSEAQTPQGDARLRPVHARERHRHARPAVRGRARDADGRQAAATIDPAKMRAAEKACAKYREAIKPPEISDEESAEFKKAGARALQAACASTASTSPTRPSTRTAARRSGSGRAADRTRSRPKFQEAEKACRDKSPMAGRTTRRTAARSDAPASRAGRRRRRGGRRGGRRARRRRRRGARPRGRADPVARATATVERRDLVDRESLAGTLGYADPGTLAAGVAGTLTALREPGQRDHPRALAVLRRRRAGGVPALRRAARLARLLARA